MIAINCSIIDCGNEIRKSLIATQVAHLFFAPKALRASVKDLGGEKR